MKLIKYFVLILILIMFCVSCKTINELVINSINDETLKKIEEVDSLILQFRSTQNKQFLKDALNKTGVLGKEAKKNKYYEAKVFGLYGEIYFFQNDIINTKKYISEIEKRNPTEERYFLLKAEIEKDINKKEVIIKDGIEKSNGTNLLKLFLAELYFVNGKFPEATGLYDESLINLSDGFKDFYKKRRDLSYQLIKTPPKNNNSIAILLKDEITSGELIQIAINEFPSFKKIIENSNSDIKLIYEKLKTDNYFYNFPGFEINIDEKIKRKDIAFFLLKTIAVLDNKPELVNKYTKLFNNADNKTINSPVPDVKTSDYFFTAVLVLVEREIMDLPDGKNFFPEKTIKGIDFIEMIRKMMRFYK